ncbi:hypothetical protein Tco_0183858 [Tanacetum coccineum]
MRVNIHEFDGNTLNPEGFIDWLVAVEEVFEFKEVPENKRVLLIATKLHGRASTWWQQLKLTRERVGKPRFLGTTLLLPSGTLLTLSPFQDELEMVDDIFVPLGNKVAKDSKIPEAMIPLLEEFSDVFPDEFPDGLLPLRDIQHYIDLEPGL